jgi:hypothetical protein
MGDQHERKARKGEGAMAAMMSRLIERFQETAGERGIVVLIVCSSIAAGVVTFS